MSFTDNQIKQDLGVDDVSIGTSKEEDREIHKVVVDRVNCIGAQSCVVVAPKVFQMDEQNLAYVLDDVDATDEETIKMAAQSCPVLAIHLYNKQGEKLFPEE